MPTSTRSSASKGAPAEDNAAGDKHELDDKPAPDAKKQKTIEETLGGNGSTAEKKPSEADEGYGEDAKHAEPKESDDDKGTKREDTKPEGEDGPSKPAATTEESTAVQEGERPAVPSSILEKGIIYFFFRGRVNIEEPKNVDEIQRSFMILRPMATDARLGEGPIGDAGNSRLIAVPKKVFPTSGKERWIAFVEKTDVSFSALRDEFLSGEDYMTKTAGARHTPAAQPAAEGVYAITTTGRESHLAYMITLPSELGELQGDLGLKEKGSFILSTRNPAYDAPRGTALPEGPDYPKEIQNSFRSLRWQPTTPDHLDYVKSQFLLIGESDGISNALEHGEDGKEDQKPREELEKLEDEDTHRMQDLKGDDSAAIFADLGARAGDYPKLETTF
ncbi:hypothetical protein Micbo1qcDRAFT_215458 [Microdochium bolleyi]|uniref:BTB domain transcription factor n=1 Tax=Microdochium bolleyi TaxID=196109 RepID=A0A136IS81_9PEZI|nr:hypothetical protein Micbo1qcDRAFT_215458 [Microdochium bolleyi]